MKNPNSKFNIALIIIAAIYLAAAISSANTLLPNVDEAWFTIPGYNLAENGYFGTSTLDETSSFRQVKLDGVRTYTYWIMPVFPLTQAIWGKVLGFGLIQTRSVSILFGLIALLSWYCLIRKTTGEVRPALIAAAILAIDYHFVYAASLGRMDMMTAALGISALAVFIVGRGRSFDRAVFFSYSLTATAFFTHPLGLIWAVSLTILIIFYDYKNLRLKHMAFAAAPFLILGALWSLYILQRPDLFAIQFGGNASDRWGFFKAPFAELQREIQLRYLANFGIGENLNRAGQIKVVLLLAYAASIVGILAVESLRKSKAAQFLMLVALQEFAMLILLDGMKQPYYMIHITPTLTAITAVFVDWLLKNKKLRFPAVGLLTIILAVHFGTHLLRLKRDEYRTSYLAVSAMLNRNVRADDLVIASSELWFGSERRGNLLDDYRFGYLTGRKADFIVIDRSHYKDWFKNLAEREPETFRYMENLLREDYSMIYDDSIYQVYKNKKETNSAFQLTKHKKFTAQCPILSINSLNRGSLRMGARVLSVSNHGLFSLPSLTAFPSHLKAASMSPSCEEVSHIQYAIS